MCPAMWAHWRHLANMIKLVLPSAHPESTIQTANWSVQPFLHSSRQKFPMLYNGQPFPPKLHRLMGGSESHLTDDSLAHAEITMQTARRSIRVFSHRWPQTVPILHFPQNCPPMTGIWPHLTHDSLAHPSPQPKQHLYRFSHFCPDDRRVSLYFTMGRTFPP